MGISGLCQIEADQSRSISTSLLPVYCTCRLYIRYLPWHQSNIYVYANSSLKPCITHHKKACMVAATPSCELLCRFARMHETEPAHTPIRRGAIKAHSTPKRTTFRFLRTEGHCGDTRLFLATMSGLTLGTVCHGGLLTYLVMLSLLSLTTAAVSFDLTELRNKVAKIKVNPRGNLWATGRWTYLGVLAHTCCVGYLFE